MSAPAAGTTGDRRRRSVVVLLTAAAVLAACGGPTPVVEDVVPVAVAEPVPFDATPLEPRPTPSPAPEPVPDPAPQDTAATTEEPSPDRSSQGPTSADAAAFVTSGAVAGLEGLEHVVVDLDGDDRPEVVATGVRDRVGVVEVAWWTDGGYEVLASDEAGPGRDIIDLRAADLNADDHVELLVAVEGEGLQSLALWRVPGRGELEQLVAHGGCHDGRHVYGVTTARLQANGDGPPVIVADCDESPLPVADWSEQRWAWEDGAYRVVEHDPPGNSGDAGGRPDGEGPPGGGRGGGQGPPDDQPGNGNGVGDGNGGDDDGDGDDDDGDDDGDGDDADGGQAGD